MSICRPRTRVFLLALATCLMLLFAGLPSSMVLNELAAYAQQLSTPPTTHAPAASIKLYLPLIQMVRVATIPNPIATGQAHTCALKTDGAVMCWGWDFFGQLGNGTTGWGYAPGPVLGIGAVSTLAAGVGHTCALMTGGGVKCWGQNDYGEIGDGGGGTQCSYSGNVCRLTPIDVVGLTSGVSAIAASNDNINFVDTSYTCAVTTGGGIKCWGPGYGVVPVDVTGLASGTTAVATGTYHACALTMNGGVKCWGQNSFGQLGDGTTTSRSSPVDVIGLTSGVSAIAASYADTCALMTNGGVKCWGQNTSGQLGDGMNCGQVCTTPVAVSGLTTGVRAIAPGYTQTCALMTSGGAKCWGDDSHGAVGGGGSSTTPVDVIGF